MMQLRDYQVAAVERLDAFYSSAMSGSRTVVSGPTGCGKSLVELELLRRRPKLWLVTPRTEIARGILEKAGADVSTTSALVRSCWEHRVVTPIRLRNVLLAGGIERLDEVLFDEGHHVLARTWNDLQLLCGMPPAALLTATPYRGSSRGTQRFLEEWGGAWPMVTLRDAARRGDVCVPCCEMLPLVDDDVVELSSSGEFDVMSVSSAYSSRLDDLAAACVGRYVGSDGLWDRTTVFALPCVSVALDLASALHRRGAAATVVHAGTKRIERDAAYDLLVHRGAALCQVAVLGEGVDLPIRRLVDAAPKMSPVAWMQMVGRCTRPVGPGEPSPEYVCTNRNLARHAYLFEGMLPARSVAACDASFGGPGRRAGGRALGLEAIGRFRAAEVKLRDGCTAIVYYLVDAANGRMHEHACVLHPTMPDPIWAERMHGMKPDGTRDWGRWRRCRPPSDLQGFGSVPQRDPSEKMLAWWKRSAESRGLDPEQPVTRKTFAILPLLFDLGMRFRS